MKCITLHRGVQVDLGGIAKAWSANYMMNKLHQAGVARGAINAGGDIVSWGEVEQDWAISIAHPLQPERDIVTVSANNGFGIATSSRIKRSWKDQDGFLHHHLIDPRTQQSSTSDLIQVSVLSSDLTLAEIVTKCVLLLGSESGIPWLIEKYPKLALIAVREDLSLIEAGDFSGYSIERNGHHE
jgi:thiamine biosynthesis lipoprotein